MSILDGHDLGLGRSPQGERGLKRSYDENDRVVAMSLPARGAWVETVTRRSCPYLAARRSPQGERGLKHTARDIRDALRLVAPRKGSVG